jgi:hypothetical protein
VDSDCALRARVVYTYVKPKRERPDYWGRDAVTMKFVASEILIFTSPFKTTSTSS